MSEDQAPFQAGFRGACAEHVESIKARIILAEVLGCDEAEALRIMQELGDRGYRLTRKAR